MESVKYDNNVPFPELRVFSVPFRGVVNDGYKYMQHRKVHLSHVRSSQEQHPAKQGAVHKDLRIHES